MEVSCAATLVTPAGTVTFNSGAFNSANAFYFTGLPGFDEADLRVAYDKKSRESGTKVHSIYDEAIHGLCIGWIFTSDPSTRNASRAFLKMCLESIRTADGTFNVTETGRSAVALTVRQEVKLDCAPLNQPPFGNTIHTFEFGLLGPDGVWS
jgi:hypothetical protein